MQLVVILFQPGSIYRLELFSTSWLRAENMERSSNTLIYTSKYLSFLNHICSDFCSWTTKCTVINFQHFIFTNYFPLKGGRHVQAYKYMPWSFKVAVIISRPTSEYMSRIKLFIKYQLYCPVRYLVKKYQYSEKPKTLTIKNWKINNCTQDIKFYMIYSKVRL